MKPADVLEVAKGAGIRVTAEGDDLVLDADAPPPASILDAFRHHKAAIVAILSGATESWLADDWQAFFDERAGIAEFDGGLPRAEAEGQAFECCVVEWLRRNPEPSEPGRCAQCGVPDASGCAVIPFGPAANGQTWLHSDCWTPWNWMRREKARMALSRHGLSPPTDEGARDGKGRD